MTALRRLCVELMTKKVLWNGTYLMTALRRLCGTLWDITYDSTKKALWNTMGYNL